MLIAFPEMVWIELQREAKLATVNEYHESRDDVLARVEASAAAKDRPEVLRIREKFGDVVKDPELQSALIWALAKIDADEMHTQLSVTRKLHFQRQQEEAQPLPPQPMFRRVSQHLSILPD